MSCLQVKKADETSSNQVILKDIIDDIFSLYRGKINRGEPRRCGLNPILKFKGALRRSGEDNQKRKMFADWFLYA